MDFISGFPSVPSWSRRVKQELMMDVLSGPVHRPVRPWADLGKGPSGPLAPLFFYH